MRRLSHRTRKILTAAGLWNNPCLICGACTTTTAEHALYEAGRQIDDPCAIIPLCFQCNVAAHPGNQIKRRAIQCALTLYERIYGDRKRLPPYYHNFTQELDAEQTDRLSVWATKLADVHIIS